MLINIIAEIGINHNGDINLAKKLIDIASLSGCNYVKFQKRNPEICVPNHQKEKIKETPWGRMSYLKYKNRLEFNKYQYDEIDNYCKQKKIKWFASVWDHDSVDFISNYVEKMKIPSALLTKHDLGLYARKKSDFLMLSTGMSNENDIVSSINVYDPDLIFHTNSTYPSPIDELNLNYILTLKKKYPNKIIGYSGHEFGLVTTFAAAALGALYIERHITLDRTMWGSDQFSSIEPGGLFKLVKGIRDLEKSFGTGKDRIILKSELKKLQSLRG